MDSRYHQFKVFNQLFEIESRYSYLRTICVGGKNSIMISALDISTNKRVTIKKFSQVFDDFEDVASILQEIRIMKKIRHENVLSVIDISPPSPSTTVFEDLYIIRDFMEIDLHHVISSPQVLNIDHARFFIYQILRGLKYLHSAGLIHRNLNPSSVLVNSNCDLKICNFGHERSYKYDRLMHYRAPEILLACDSTYTPAIDIWSAGCIFGEILARQPLFPGDCYIQQLRLISDIMGRPPESEIDFVSSERAKRFLLSIPMKEPLPMGKLFPQYSKEYDAHSFLKRLLEFHPYLRLTAEEALAHPFLAGLHEPDDEPVADYQFPDFEFEKKNLSTKEFQDLIWNEIREFHPDLPESYPKSPRPQGGETEEKAATLSLADGDDPTLLGVDDAK